MICMYKIAVMGDRDSVLGFAALGLETKICDTADEAVRQIRAMADGYAVIYITEKLAAMIPEEINRFSSSLFPAVILIPGISGNTGCGMSAVKKSVERAVGADITALM